MNSALRHPGFRFCRVYVGQAAVILILFFGAAPLLEAVPSLMGLYYSNTVVAVTGVAGLRSINNPQVSINDTNRIAFIGGTMGIGSGTSTTYSSVWIADDNGSPPRNVNPSFSSASRSFSFPQINNADQVIASETVSTSVLSYVARTWDANSGSYKIIQSNAKLGLNNSLTESSLSNDGFASYVQSLDNQATAQLIFWNGVSTSTIATFSLASVTTLPPLSPMIGAGGNIVIRAGINSTSPIILYPASSAGITIASPPAFNAIGQSPGISHDGTAVAFYGSDANGPGIFAAVNSSGAFSPQRIAGASDGFDSFEADTRVGIQSSQQGAAVVYLATMDGIEGLYVSLIHMVGGPTAPFQVDPPLEVMETGDTNTAFPGAVESFALQDPINTNGVLAFWVQTDAGAQAVIRSDPYVLGLDVSHFQDYNPTACANAPISWSAVQSAGNAFVFVKASQGTGVRDGNNPTTCGSQLNDQTASNIAGATSAGLLVSPYHLAGTGNPPILGDATAEAIFFLQRASAYIGNGYLPPTLDLENLGQYGVTANVLSLWASTWLSCVQQATGVTPIIYADTTTMEALLDAGFSSQYAQWISAPDGNPIATPMAPDETPFPGWQFKQYTLSGTCAGITGNMGTVDLDSFHGGLAQLTALTNYPPIVLFSGIGWTPLPPPAGGQFAFQIFAPTLQSATVQVSQDLLTWTDAGTVTIGANRVGYFYDSNLGNAVIRFYRIEY
jgi:GH25 family lysozyme M1 (1,4-beta-N-acetylmuramidase)